MQAAKNLKPDYVSLIMPAKWYNGGRGLDEFRTEMLSDVRVSKLVDFEDSNDCFAGVDIAGGVCYFLWDATYNGLCKVENRKEGSVRSHMRKLNDSEIFIRDIDALAIIQKVLARIPKGNFFDSRVSSQKPFGLRTYVRPEDGDLTLRYNGGEGPYPREKVTSGHA